MQAFLALYFVGVCFILYYIFTHNNESQRNRRYTHDNRPTSRGGNRRQ